MKRGQEEIVGFVAIMILLAVVLLVLLVFSFRTSTNDVRQNSDAYYFLASGMEVTSECVDGFDGNYLALRELIVSCQSGKTCLNGASCLMANKTLVDLIEKGFKPGADSPTKGYKIEARYENNLSSASRGSSLFSASGGLCDKSLRGASYTIPASPGGIIVKIELCS